MTALVWSLALAGIVGKLAFPRVSERLWTGFYILFGWVAVLALRPLSHGLPVLALGLLIAGGLVYTTGCWVFLNSALPFRRAVWHAFVCAGAGLHYAAILSGVTTAHS
jgi:hemolysin III